MTVRLMLTCLCDAFYGEVGIATVRVLEYLGCRVEFPENQTCCGQPPYNAGDWSAARKIAEHQWKALGFDEPIPIVTPSGSCAAMVREGYPMILPDRKHLEHVYEFSEFIVHQLGITALPNPASAPAPVKTALHRACHGRGLGLKNEQEMLLSSLPGIELVAFDQQEQCCGFGGAFSATLPTVSTGIGNEKLKNILASGAEQVVSGDMGCLMHLRGLIEKQELPLRTRHIAEVLAEAIPEGVASR